MCLHTHKITKYTCKRNDLEGKIPQSNSSTHTIDIYLAPLGCQVWYLVLGYACMWDKNPCSQGQCRFVLTCLCLGPLHVYAWIPRGFHRARTLHTCCIHMHLSIQYPHSVLLSTQCALSHALPPCRWTSSCPGCSLRGQTC